MRKILWIIGILGALLALWHGAGWLALFRSGLKQGEVRTEAPATPFALPDHPAAEGISLRIETVATGLDTPWSLVFTSPERMLITERPGQIRVIENGMLLDKPLHTFSEVSERGEEGLMSLALDPAYETNRRVYVSLAYANGEALKVKVLRFEDQGNTLERATVIIDQIPAARYHAGSAIAFGPDGKLYITTGDATDKQLAQDLTSLAGKVLRINADGSIPEDNPFPGSPIWSYGHRNSQGIAWRLDTGVLYSSEHGPSVFDGPAGGDEINLIEKGKNYGWPLVSHEDRREGTEAPLIIYTPAEAPASLMVYSGRAFPRWRGHLFFGALRGEGLVRVEIDPHHSHRVLRSEKIAEVNAGRIRAVVEAPDGSIYFTTSNRDGRGEPASEDDRVFRLVFTRDTM